MSFVPIRGISANFARPSAWVLWFLSGDSSSSLVAKPYASLKDRYSEVLAVASFVVRTFFNLPVASR